MKKFIPLLIIPLIFPLISLWFISLDVFASTIIDGDLVKTSDSPDVYITKTIGADKYKRLILNPEIFNQYSHLRWENIKTIDQAELDEYEVSDLVRAQGDERVYKLYSNGDTGEKQWIKTADDFLGLGYKWNAIYIINIFERDSYSTGQDLTFQAPQEPTAPQRTTPMTIKVPADYATIQGAINASINGDTISINSGTYMENITIEKSIKLINGDSGFVTIDGNGVDNAITIKNAQNDLPDGSQVLIQRFKIKSKDKYGIYCNSENAAGITLKNSHIADSGWGIVIENNCQLTLLNNLIYDNKLSSNADGAGVLIKNNGSAGVSEITNNTIADNYHGIWVENANVKIMNNIVVRNIGGTGSVDSTGIYHIGSGKSENTYNDAWSNGWDYKGDAMAGNGSINKDPRFVGEAQKNYSLLTGETYPSPCIDAGNPDIIYNDGTLITSILLRNDMGAFGGPGNITW